MKCSILRKLLLAAHFAGSILSATEAIDLSGEWKLALDAEDKLMTITPDHWIFNDTIRLPNTLTLAGKGTPLAKEPRLDRATMKNLHQRFTHVGPAWYQREIDVPTNWTKQAVILELERVLWESRVWVNGEAAGVADSLSAPHRHDVTKWLRPGRNTITLRIDNREKLPIGIGHAYTDATQTIWNGAVGSLRLIAEPKARIKGLRLHHGGSGVIAAAVDLENSSNEAPCTFEVRVSDPDGKKLVPEFFRHTVPAGASRHTFSIKLGNNQRLWDEFDPSLHQIEVRLKSEAGESVIRKNYGHRRIRTDGRKILVNDRPVFLRGTLECAIFPKTGHPDMTGREWEKLCSTFKAHGLNHIRFHSYCPPRAAFDAADKQGIYLQVELPNWSFKMGKQAPVDEYFRAEGERILAEYGDHPSFVLFCLGNELAGDLSFMDSLVEHFRSHDPDKLYTSTSFAFSGRGKKPGPADDYFITQESASGWVRGQGFLNQTPPNTASDYRQGLSCVPIPLVSHEVGQYNNFPNLAELPKYEGGPLRSLAYEAIRDDLKKKGRLEEAPRLTRDSGKLAALLYKEDMERALRTPEQAGIQLLDIRDFPGQSTATVGILDAFGDSKDFITPQKFREFAGPSVPLARMKKMVWSSEESFQAELEIAHFGKAPLLDANVRWSLADGSCVVCEGAIWRDLIPLGSGIKLGDIAVPLKSVTKAAQLDLTVSIDGTGIRNSWSIWVYPPTRNDLPQNVEIHRSTGARLSAALAAGKRVLLLVADRASVKVPIDARFIPVFWSPLHFRNQPGTLGATINSSHPVFSAFPTDTFTNWQWWEMFSTSFAMDLDALALKPEMPLLFVDKFDRNALPAAIWQTRVGPGSLLVCTLDIESDPDKRIAARQLKSSILDYMASDGFSPSVAMDDALVQSLFNPSRYTVRAESEVASYPARNAVDGDPSTYWHTEWKSGAKRLPATLTMDLGEITEVTGFTYAPRPDMSRARVKQYSIEASDDGNTWRELINAEFPDSPAAAKVAFPKPANIRYLRFVALSDQEASGHAAIADFGPEIPHTDDPRGLGIVPGFNDGK